jgi:type IV secretory pathway VirB4 component
VVVEFAKNPATANLVRDLAFAYFRPEQFPPHSALIEQFLFNPCGGVREREESDRIGKLLRAWSRDGEKGKLFDGVSNIRIDGRVAHFELGQIPEHATEMRAAANFLVANYGRQKIITMPRAVPKIAIFEEAARTLEIPGGIRMIQEYYRQMRKFGCNILAVVQQYDVLKTSEVRGAMIGNSKMFLKQRGVVPLLADDLRRGEFTSRKTGVVYECRSIAEPEAFSRDTAFSGVGDSPLARTGWS